VQNFSKSSYYLLHFSLSVCLSAFGCKKQLDSHSIDFRDCLSWGVLMKSVVIIFFFFFCLKSDRNNRHSRLRAKCVFWIVHCCLLLHWWERTWGCHRSEATAITFTAAQEFTIWTIMTPQSHNIYMVVSYLLESEKFFVLSFVLRLTSTKWYEIYFVLNTSYFFYWTAHWFHWYLHSKD
jgi:hypothetical protein